MERQRSPSTAQCNRRDGGRPGSSASSSSATGKGAGARRGDRAPTDEESMYDEKITYQLLAILQPDFASICRERGWPTAPFLACSSDSACFSLASAPPLYQPEGKGHRSRAPPAASGPSVCPSSDFRASNQVCCPRTRPSATSRTRSAAAAARLHAAIPEPAAPTTITQALATLRPPFPLF